MIFIRNILVMALLSSQANAMVTDLETEQYGYRAILLSHLRTNWTRDKLTKKEYIFLIGIKQRLIEMQIDYKIKLHNLD